MKRIGRGTWAVALACMFVAGLTFACVGGGNADDDDEDDDEPELDLAALVVAAFEEEPSRLPGGLSLDSIDFTSRWDDQALATVDFEMSGSAGVEAFGVAVIFRDEATARAVLQEEAAGWAAEESKTSRGRYCTWSPIGFYTNPDFESVSLCLGRSERVYLEVELGEVADEDPEGALELLLALEKHFAGLAEDATRRPRTVPPEPLAALLGSLPLPGPDGIPFASYKTFSLTDDLAPNGLIGVGNWGGDATTGEFALVYSFESAAAADVFRESLFPAMKRSATDCAPPLNAELRQCAYQLEETVAITQRRVSGTGAAAADPRLKSWVEDIAEHVAGLREGEIPRAPRQSPTPNGNRTAAPPAASPTAAATPTATPLPPIARVNAGTWTFDMVVLRNTCPGGLPAVGSTIRLQYELTDLDDDGYITEGELFGVEEFLPRQTFVGVFQGTLPNVSFVAEARNGNLTGFATVKLGFSAVDEAYIDYTETYPVCEIVAQ